MMIHVDFIMMKKDKIVRFEMSLIMKDVAMDHHAAHQGDEDHIREEEVI